MNKLVQFGYISKIDQFGGQNFDFKIRRDHEKYFLWEPRLWVGRRYEPNLGYISKNDGI